MTNLIAAFPNFAKALRIKLLMLYRKIIALCSNIHTKHLDALCEQEVELVISVLTVRNVTIGL